MSGEAEGNLCGNNINHRWQSYLEHCYEQLGH